MEPITREESLRLLAEAPVAHIGVISGGEPYVTPMSFVLDGERILFRTKSGKRFDGMLSNPTVCIEASTFDSETGDWVSVIVKGRAAETVDGDTKVLTVEKLLQKYQQALGSPLGRGGMQPMAGFPHVFEVEIVEITGMSSGRGLTPRTRPGRL
jgi:nitroimidazol reductase NimA-like FMN-containing flavoprotein (pyridoxamine 5'-phosphate oxidase superfamily)